MDGSLSDPQISDTPDSTAVHESVASDTDGVSLRTEPESISDQRDEILVVATTSMGHFMCHFAELMFNGLFLVIMAQFTIDPKQVTFLPLVGLMLMGVGAIPIGLWVDAWNPKKILFIYFLMMTASCLFVAWADSFWMLFAALTLLGFALSMYHPAGLTMLSLGVGARGRALGINGVAGSLGAASAPAVAAFFAGAGMWRMAYVTLAAISLAAGIFMLIAFRGGRFRMKHSVEDNPTPATSTEETGQKHRKNLLPFITILLVMTLGGFNYRCLVTALPTYLTGDSVTPGSLIRGGLFASIVLLSGGIGQLLGGWLADKFGSRQVYIFLTMSLVPLSLILGLVGGTVMATVVAAVLAIGLFGQQPVENSLLAETTSRSRRSLSYATKFVMTFGIGALGAQVVGIVWEQTDSLAPVFFIIAGSAVLMSVILLLYRRITRQAISPGTR